MFLVAITGGIATGKSTVSKVFKNIGVPVIDADQIARESKYTTFHHTYIYNYAFPSMQINYKDNKQ